MIYRRAGAVSKHEKAARGETGTHKELKWLKISNFTDIEFSGVGVDAQHETAILGSRIVPGVFNHRVCTQLVAR